MEDTSLLEDIGNLIDQKLEPVKKDLQDVKQSVGEVKQVQVQTNERLGKLEDGQVQTNNSLAHLTTAGEAVLAGQQELQKTVAREASVMNLGARLTRKVNDHEERITELEKERNIPHPHKH